MSFQPFILMTAYQIFYLYIFLGLCYIPHRRAGEGAWEASVKTPFQLRPFFHSPLLCVERNGGTQHHTLLYYQSEEMKIKYFISSNKSGVTTDLKISHSFLRQCPVSATLSWLPQSYQYLDSHTWSLFNIF